MTTHEKRLWCELALWGAVLFYAWARLTDGVTVFGHSIGPNIVDQDTVTLLRAYGSIGVLAAIGQVIIRSVLFPQNPASLSADERDLFIERRADQVGYWVGIVAVHMLIFHVLLSERFRNATNAGLDFVSPAGILLGLLTVLVMQELFKAASALVLYRRS